MLMLSHNLAAGEPEEGHAEEGSHFNKSLLKRGTNYLARSAMATPCTSPSGDFSITGSAARISVIATATPASCQAEVTLKFVTHTKKVDQLCSMGLGKRQGFLGGSVNIPLSERSIPALQASLYPNACHDTQYCCVLLMKPQIEANLGI